MNDVGRVQRFERPKCLIYEVLGMVIGQVLCSNDSVHVSFHKLLYNYRSMSIKVMKSARREWKLTINFGKSL